MLSWVSWWAWKLIRSTTRAICFKVLNTKICIQFFALLCWDTIDGKVQRTSFMGSKLFILYSFSRQRYFNFSCHHSNVLPFSFYLTKTFFFIFIVKTSKRLKNGLTRTFRNKCFEFSESDTGGLSLPNAVWLDC